MLTVCRHAVDWAPLPGTPDISVVSSAISPISLALFLSAINHQNRGGSGSLTAKSTILKAPGASAKNTLASRK